MLNYCIDISTKNTDKYTKPHVNNKLTNGPEAINSKHKRLAHTHITRVYTIQSTGNKIKKKTTGI